MNLKSNLLLIVLVLSSFFAEAGNVWRLVSQQSTADRSGKGNGLVYALDEPAMKAQLLALAPQQVIELPMPDGAMRTFRVWETSIMPAELAAKYPGLRTFTGEAVNEPTITAKLDITELGFHAVVFDGGNTTLIDPVQIGSNNYKVIYKNSAEHSQNANFPCNVTAKQQSGHSAAQGARTAQKLVNGTQHRKYRIAIACNHQYAEKNTGSSNPSKSATLSYVVTTMNRINGVYERELSVTMTLAAHEDTLLFVNDTTDPMGGLNTDPVGLMDLNQKLCDSLIGTANYDLGHVFSTGAGGLSEIACVCSSTTKARSVTGNANPTGDGFDIDYVAHEIGHEFGSNHTFNNNTSGSCANNAVPEFAYEPGSGSTIMAYAGICASDDIQKHSDDYFCASSLLQINEFVTTAGDVCAVKINAGNKPPSLASFTSTYSIPYLTPFELIAPVAVDSVADSITTYCWEQWNLGDFGRALKNTELSGPLFRSYPPDTATKRIFPNNTMVLAGIKSNAGIEGAESDKLPAVARYLTFKLTVRSIFHGLGCFLFPDDSVHLDVVNVGNGTGFEVTSQNTEGLKYIGGSVQTVKWDVASTDAAPINAANVDIYLSVDGGNTWKYNLGNFPNNGSAIVTLPNLDNSTIRARIKVKGSGNVFFNVNARDFAVISNPGIYGDILLFPVPAKNVITVVTGDKGEVSAVAYNAVGATTWRGSINGISDIDVTYWPRGVYIIKLIDVRNQQTIKKFVLE